MRSMMANFAAYLENEGYLPKTIRRSVGYATQYTHWLNHHHIAMHQATYNDLLAYIGHLQTARKSAPLINNQLRSIRRYYTYLQLPNIAYGVHIKGTCQSQLLPLTATHLDQLYHHFLPASIGPYRHTDLLFLGLMIYQALDEQDILRLQFTDLDLAKGTLYVPAGIKRKAGRTIALMAHQVIPLQHYLTHHRKENELLFYPQCISFNRLHDQFKVLSIKVKNLAKTLNISFIRFSQLRKSRITLWIQQYGLRKAQYLAGFRQVHNVEVYQQQDTTDLVAAVQQYHPLKRHPFQ